MDAAKTSREFERKDTREEAGKAVADVKGKGCRSMNSRPQKPPAYAASRPASTPPSAPTSAYGPVDRHAKRAGPDPRQEVIQRDRQRALPTRGAKATRHSVAFSCLSAKG